jgi:chemotaxis protein CheD
VRKAASPARRARRRARASEEIETQRETVYLHPGRLLASREPCAITTVLGSCVAIFLWDSEAGVGGLNHYLLPYWAGPGDDSARFGNMALALLIGELLALGAAKSRLAAKIFGGACVLPELEGTENLGAKNVELALSLLERENIPILAQDVGGRRGRKLVVYTDTGDAWVKLL